MAPGWLRALDTGSTDSPGPGRASIRSLENHLWSTYYVLDLMASRQTLPSLKKISIYGRASYVCSVDIRGG